MKRYIVCTILASFLLHLNVATKSHARPYEQSGAQSPERATPHGLKSWIAKKLLRATAQALRSDSATTVCYALGELGGKEVKKVICQHRFTVAGVLDDIASWTGKVTREMVKDQLTGALHQAGLIHSTASRVAFYIATALDWALL